MENEEPRLYSIRCCYHTETDTDIKVSRDGEEERAKWLSKWQIEYRMVSPGAVEITAPEWLLIEKGLV